MALIDCPGCGNKVSDRAKACPKCGMNLSLKKKQEEQLKEVKHNNLKVDEEQKQLDQPKVQTEELKKIKEEETDKPIFKEEVKEERTSKPNLEEKTKEPEKIISKEISEPEKKKKGNKFWLAIGLIIGFIIGVLFWFVLALIIPDDKMPSAGGNTGTTVVGGTDSQSTENSGSSKKTDVSGATLAFKYVDVSLIPNGLGEGTYKVGKDIDPGEYIAYGLNSVSQIKQFNSLDEQEDTEEIDGLFIDLTLEENQYIEVESGIILPKSTFDMNNLAQYGIYKVGQDIEAGEYKVASISDSYESSYEEVDGALGALEVADEALGGNVFKTVDLYDGQKYVTLEDGQYVRVVDAALYKN